eukprot:CAMPEP_0183738038 /NCGR_PEP_ID=MMETSP0737-20130205/53675_1 /TAXON_ID=385413 /ORGANISM="Thalassiosira miniscula, Strain CCMP1093" /LENGTH=275 /DNA_ID=CAMNT_0025972485 /DNA_START=30 /DNA_END=857 /DNA_ORIENTATION=-
MPSRDEASITLSLGGVEFCLTPSPTDDDEDDVADSMMSISKICNGEVVIDLNNFVGTLRVTNYNIDAPLGGEDIAAKPKAKKSADDKGGNKVNRKRYTNHARDDKMKNALEEWDRIKNSDEVPTKAAFARARGIEPRTFTRYARDDPSKRPKIGQRGNRSLVSADTAQLLALHYADGGNGDDDTSPPTSREVIDSLMLLQPELTPAQAANYVQRTWKKNANLTKWKKQSRREINAAFALRRQNESLSHVPEIPTAEYHYSDAPEGEEEDPELERG